MYYTCSSQIGSCVGLLRFASCGKTSTLGLGLQDGSLVQDGSRWFKMWTSTLGLGLQDGI
jgi:hypothetical protein